MKFSAPLISIICASLVSAAHIDPRSYRSDAPSGTAPSVSVGGNVSLKAEGLVPSGAPSPVGASASISFGGPVPSGGPGGPKSAHELNMVPRSASFTQEPLARPSGTPVQGPSGAASGVAPSGVAAEVPPSGAATGVPEVLPSAVSAPGSAPSGPPESVKLAARGVSFAPEVLAVPSPSGAKPSAPAAASGAGSVPSGGPRAAPSGGPGAAPSGAVPSGGPGAAPSGVAPSGAPNAAPSGASKAAPSRVVAAAEVSFSAGPDVPAPSPVADGHASFASGATFAPSPSGQAQPSGEFVSAPPKLGDVSSKPTEVASFATLAPGN